MVKNKLFAISAIALVASAYSSYEDEERMIRQHDMMENSLRNFDGFRGAWLGFNRGLYKQSSWRDME